MTKKSLILFILLFSLLNSCTGTTTASMRKEIKNSYSQNELIFWKYNPNLNIEILDKKDFVNLPEYCEAFVKIPLSDFAEYFWDEQILRMMRDTFNNKSYLDGLRTLHLESDRDSVFFSIIIGNRIVMNGLNRTMSVSAARGALDDLIPQQIRLSMRDDSVYFRFVTDCYTTSSIWDH